MLSVQMFSMILAKEEKAKQVTESRNVLVFLRNSLGTVGGKTIYWRNTEDIFPMLTFVNDVSGTGNFILSNLFVFASR